MRSLWILPFKLALATNFFSVLFNIINDCDETYNYWEPLHFISTWGEGGGFQTWEYSPSFALRSYLYLWVFGWPASVSFFLGLPNWFGFLLVRFFLGFISGISSSVLSSVVARFVSEEHHRQSKEFESNKKQILFSFLLSFCACMSPGNFLSSTTLLPSGPCSSLTALMLIFWLRRRYFLAVGCVAFSGLVVWPFAAVLGLPLATYMVITGKFRCLVKSALVWLLLITFPLVAVDSFYFGRFVLAPINILRYNLFPYDKQQTGSASQLYGVEPISFYLKNYILNQNIMCILALLSLIHAVIKLVLLPFRIKKSVEKHFNETETSLSKICIIVCTCLAIWNSIFFLQAHKEERFLFPCYPLIAIASTIVISEIIEALTSKTKLAGIKSSVTCFIIITFCSVVFLTSVSRIFTLVRWHSSPMYLVKHLPAPLGQSHKPLLCMGRDWHFFPSRFFLPGGGEKWEVGFVQSNFSGQLPGQFAKPVSSGMVSSSTRKDGNHFNSGNVEEIDRYVINASDKCSFMLDRDSPTAFRETLYVSEQETWLSFANRTLLESTSCSFNETFLSLDVIYCRLLRTFYIPVLSQKMDLTTALHILVRRNHGLFA